MATFLYTDDTIPYSWRLSVFPSPATKTLLVEAVFMDRGISTTGNPSTTPEGSTLPVPVELAPNETEEDYLKRINHAGIEEFYEALTDVRINTSVSADFDSQFLILKDTSGREYVYAPRFLRSQLQSQTLQIRIEDRMFVMSFELPMTKVFSDSVFAQTHPNRNKTRGYYWRNVAQNAPYNYIVRDGFSRLEVSALSAMAQIPRTSDSEVHIPWIYIDEKASLDNQSAQDAADLEEALAGITSDSEIAAGDKTVSLSEQAILLYQLPSLAILNKRLRKLGTVDSSGKQAMLYDRFAAIDTDKVSEMESLINSMTSPSSVNAIFDLIKPVHLSACIPRLRLFKLYLPADPRVKDIAANSDNAPRIPVEYELDEHLRDSVGNSDGTRSTNILGSTLTTNTGVGIEAFAWEFNGTNQFEAEKMVSANLKLRAQSIQALEELRFSRNSGLNYKFSDLFIPEILEAGSPYSIPTPDGDDVNQYQAQQVKQFESRVLVEYGIDKTNPVFGTTEGKKVLEALSQLRISLNLALTTYTLDLRDDGSVGVDINFIGRLEAHAMDPTFGSILPAKTAGEALKERRRKYYEYYAATKKQNTKAAEEKAKAKQALAKYIKDYKETNSANAEAIEGKKWEEEKAYKTLLNSISTIDTKIEKTKDINKYEDRKAYFKAAVADANRLQLYRSVYDKLIKKDSIRAITLDPRNITSNPLTDKSCIVAEEADSLSKKMAGIPADANSKVAGANAAAYKNVNTKGHLEAGLKEFSNKLSAIAIPRYTDTHYVIPFIYFGDLLDAVLDNMFELREETSNDIRTILGPLAIKRNQFLASGFQPNVSIDRNGKTSVTDDLGTNVTVVNQYNQADVKADVEKHLNGKNVKDKYIADTQTVLANLADVPISFNLFLQWWAEKVSNKGLLSYSLKAFLADAINSLIVASLQADSTKVLLPQQNVRIKSSVWESATDKNNPDALGFTHKGGKELKINTGFSNREIYGYKPGNYFNLLNIETLKSAAPKKKKLPLAVPSQSGGGYESDYMLIYVDSTEWNRKYKPGRVVEGSSPPIFEYDRDMRDGIYHLESGKDTGMVKDIKLTAQTVEFYEEMQITNALKTGKRPVHRVYQATVTMSGVTFFRPGQTVYINAAAYGEFDTLLKFGLCGYYTIRTTSCTVSSGEFVTELVCDFLNAGAHVK